jgi:microcystin synthetase protein McyJ
VTQDSRLLKLLVQPDAVQFYTWLGDDVIPHRSEHFRDSAKPLWLNLGYWKDARTYPAACAALTALIGDAARLGPEDKVLDVGFGFGEQHFIWLDRFRVKTIIGINNTPLHVDIAQRRVRARDLEDRVQLLLASATAVPFGSEDFDAVLALECAFHFNTREAFFGESIRVLRPGGRLAITDMIPLPGASIYEHYHAETRRMLGIPDANMYDRDTYAEKLRAAGFSNVVVTSIREYVYPGMIRYANARLAGRPMTSIEVVLEPEDLAPAGVAAAATYWEKSVGIGDYVIATANKPYK